MNHNIHVVIYIKIIVTSLISIIYTGLLISHGEKANFHGNVRDKFGEKLAYFTAILWEFSRQTSLKNNREKTADFVVIFRAVCTDETSVFNVFLTDVIICSFNNNMLQK